MRKMSGILLFTHFVDMRKNWSDAHIRIERLKHKPRAISNKWMLCASQSPSVVLRVCVCTCMCECDSMHVCVCIGMHESEYTWIYMQLWYSGNCYIQCLPHQTHASKIKLKSTMYLNTDTKTSLLKSKKTSTFFSNLKKNIHLKQKHTNKTRLRHSR